MMADKDETLWFVLAFIVGLLIVLVLAMAVPGVAELLLTALEGGK